MSVDDPDQHERDPERAERRLRAKVRLARLALKAVGPVYRSWPRRNLA